MNQLSTDFSTAYWIAQFEDGYRAKMGIVGSCTDIESDYRSAVFRLNKAEGSNVLSPEEYLYELRQLVLRLEFVIRRDKIHRSRVEQPQAAPVEVVAKPAVKNNKPRAVEVSEQEVLIGVKSKNRKNRRQLAEAA